MIRSGDLQDRAERGRRVVPANGTDDVAEQLRTLRARIKAARVVEPAGREAHCRDCFERGRDAALRVIDGAQ